MALGRGGAHNSMQRNAALWLNYIFNLSVGPPKQQAETASAVKRNEMERKREKGIGTERERKGAWLGGHHQW